MVRCSRPLDVSGAGESFEHAVLGDLSRWKATRGQTWGHSNLQDRSSGRYCRCARRRVGRLTHPSRTCCDVPWVVTEFGVGFDVLPGSGHRWWALLAARVPAEVSSRVSESWPWCVVEVFASPDRSCLRARTPGSTSCRGRLPRRVRRTCAWCCRPFACAVLASASAWATRALAS